MQDLKEAVATYKLKYTNLEIELGMLKAQKIMLPRKIRRLKTTGNLNNSKLSNSLESVAISKKNKDPGFDVAMRLNRSHHKSRAEGSVEKRRSSNNQFLNNSVQRNITKSFEKKVFDSFKTNMFGKSLMVNFKDFLKLNKSRDNTHASN